MVTLKRKYSWWSPKNSKWLQENLTDMDAQVTVMIKLIKEDAVRFSRRPKMNYKKRPDQLLKLVEESYRAYRSLAERYDYATGALHQAHKTMSEAFPNEIPFNDDSPSLDAPATEGFKMPHPVRAFLYPNDLHKEGAGLSPSQSHSAGKKRLRQGDYLFGSGGGAAEQAKFTKRRVTKDQNVCNKDNDPKALIEHKVKKREQSSKNGFSAQNTNTRVISEAELVGKVDDVVLKLKQMIAKLQAGKKASLRYQQSLEKVSNMELRELNEQATRAENELGTLVHSFSMAKAGVTNYLQCLETLSALETKLSHCQEEAGVLTERASKAETEVQILKQDLTRLEGENEAATVRYNQCLEKIADFETKLSHAEDETRRHIETTKILGEKNLSCKDEVLCLKKAEESGVLNERVLNERACKAETEVQILKQDLTRLEGENEAATVRYNQCLEKIADFETKLSHAKDETRRHIETTKILGEKNLSCIMSIKNLQDEVLCLKKAEESGVLNERVLNERASKAENEVQILKQDLTRLEGENEAATVRYNQCLEKIADFETKLSHAEDETRRHIETTKILGEKNLSCILSIKNLQDEVLCLKKAEESGVLNERVLNERASKAETEVQILKQDLTRLEAENEAAILRCNQCLEKISDLETQFCHAEDEAKKHIERTKILDEENLSCTMSMKNLQAEVLRLKEAEDSGVLNERVLNERASKAETEVQILKQDLTRLEAENEAAILRCNQCLEKISDLETKLSHAEDETRRHIERAIILDDKNLSCTMSMKILQNEVLSLKEAEEAGVLNERVLTERVSKTETEVQILKEDLTRLDGENEAAILRYKQCLEKISDLETKLSHAEDETRRHVQRIKVLDEKNLSSTMSIKNLQDTVLCLMEAERPRILNERVSNERASKAETEVQILKQDLARLEGENEAAILRYKQCSEKISHLETKLSHAEDETRRHIEKTIILDEKNLSCAISIKNLQDKVLCMKEAEENLKKQVELRLDEKNASQQVIYCLKEEINELNVQYHSVVEQVEHVGFKPDSIGLCVTRLQQENSKMKKLYHDEKEENASLLAKLEELEKLSQNNALLETSLLDVNLQLEELREKQMALEDTSKSLHQEKSNLVADKAALVSQVEIATENLARLAEKNIFLEKSLYDVNAELEESSTKSKSLEEYFHSLKNEKLGLITERDTLVTKLESMGERLKGLERCCAELGEKHVYLEKEKDALLHEVSEVQGLLDQEKQMHASFAQSNEILMGNLEDHIRKLQEKHRLMENEIEEEHDKAMKAQLEIFIWQICVRNIEEKSYSLLTECQKLLEASKLSEKLVIDLEQKNLHQQLSVESLLNQVNNLKMAMHQVLKLLKTDVDYECPDKTEDERLVQHILKKIEDNDSELSELQDDKQQFLLEKVVLVTIFQQAMWDLRDFTFAYRNENSKLLEEIKISRKDYSNLKEEKCMLEEENIYILEETMFLSNLCLILKSFVAEKAAELKGLWEGLDSLQVINSGLEQEIKMTQEGMEMVEAENLNLKAAVEKLETELNTIRNQKDLELRAVDVCNIDLDDERTAEFVKLKGSLCALVGENKEMKSEITKYALDIIPLVESIKHVEDLVFSHISSPSANNQEVAKPRHDKNSQQLNGDHNLTTSGGIPDLQDLQRRVKAFEMALIEMKRLMQRESVDANIKTGKAVVVEPKEVEHWDDLKKINTRESELEISSAAKNVIIVKDIPLDQVASSSSYDHGHDLYATSLRRSSWIDEKQLESWGIVDKDCTNHMTVNKTPKGASPAGEIGSSVFHEGRNSSTILQEEKEMAIDNLKVSKRVSWAHEEENKKTVLQRLACDNLKLSNLKGTVQGLKKKIQKIPKIRRTEHFEYDKVEGQLLEVGEAITQLLDSNKKLRKNLEETVPANRDGKAELKSKESGNVSVEVQRMFEKIECLDLEVQKMQLVLMKLDNKHGSERSSSAPARRKRVLLRDYLYSDKEKQ